MRNGRGMSGRFARSSITAKTWPMNCTRIRVVIRASITRPSGSRLHTIEMHAEHDQRDVREIAWSGAAGRTR